MLGLVRDIKNISIAFNMKIVSAESCTGGMIASFLTSISGASNFFDRGFVTYSIESKKSMLNLDMSLIERYGVISEQTAEAMARGAILNSNSNVAITTTGVVGPDSVEGQQVGTVCFACIVNDNAFTKKNIFHKKRNENRYLATRYALNFLLDNLKALDFFL